MNFFLFLMLLSFGFLAFIAPPISGTPFLPRNDDTSTAYTSPLPSLSSSPTPTFPAPERWNPSMPDDAEIIEIHSDEYLGNFTRQISFPNTNMTLEQRQLVASTMLNLTSGHEKRVLEGSIIERRQWKTDPIENDPTLHCYHFPIRWGHPYGYRRCYRKDLWCNIKWRHEVMSFRRECAGNLNLYYGGCIVRFEPDIETDEYCGNTWVEEDDQGRRKEDCEPQGIGEGAACPAPPGTTSCGDLEDPCIHIEPELYNRSCRWRFENCWQIFEALPFCAGDVKPTFCFW